MALEINGLLNSVIKSSEALATPKKNLPKVNNDSKLVEKEISSQKKEVNVLANSLNDLANITDKFNGNADSSVQIEEVRQAVKNVNAFVKNIKREINFSLSEYTGKVVIKVINPESEEVIREIPAEELQKLAKKLQDSNAVLFDDNA